MMDDIFQDYLDKFVIVYLGDILFFSDFEADHEHHVRLVLERLLRYQLYCKRKNVLSFRLALPIWNVSCLVLEYPWIRKK
jgi:hypothetical protein